MSKLFELIKNDYVEMKEITEETYNKKKEELSESEFNNTYIKKKLPYLRDAFKFYEYTIPLDKSEILPFLICKLLEEQEVATRKLRTISGILVFTFVASIISVLIIILINISLA